MRNYKINIKDVLIKISLLIYSFVILIRPYLIKILGSNKAVLLLMLCGIVSILIWMVILNKIRVSNMGYITICIFMFIPFLYKNAYMQDGYYTYLFYYLYTIIFCILLSFIKLNEEDMLFIMKIFIVFAFITSLITWFSFIYPKLYDLIFISALPIEDQLIARHDFWNLGMRMGLSNHYSRNAFYIVLGVIGSIILYKKNMKKKYIVLALFFLVTLLLVGKRAHLLFLIIAIFISYMIYEKTSFKKIINILKYVSLGAIFLTVVIIFIPGTSTIIERLFNTNGVDISTGRFELYRRVWKLFMNNSYSPIGWGQFSKSTNYFFAGVHNDYLQLLCETGIVGFCFIIISNIYILIKTIFIARSKKNPIILGVLIYQVFFMIYSLTGIPHYDIETYMVYFVFACFVWNICSYNRRIKYVK